MLVKIPFCSSGRTHCYLAQMRLGTGRFQLGFWGIRWCSVVEFGQSWRLECVGWVMSRAPNVISNFFFSLFQLEMILY